MLTDFQAFLPYEYLYGLKRIELLERNSKSIGEPYAIYRESDKTILIYSDAGTFPEARSS